MTLLLALAKKLPSLEQSITSACCQGFIIGESNLKKVKPTNLLNFRIFPRDKVFSFVHLKLNQTRIMQVYFFQLLLIQDNLKITNLSDQKL